MNGNSFRAVFEANAAELRELHAAIHATFTHRSESRQRWQAWEDACLKFHNSYDSLAFPGRLGQAMSLLAKNDLTTLEAAVRFLEANPWFFRSGYLKVEMIRHLRQAPLTPEQRIRLQQVIIARIEEMDTPREFRWYCRLAPYVSDSTFEQQVAHRAKSSASMVSKHAQWVLSQLKGRKLLWAGAGIKPARG